MNGRFIIETEDKTVQVNAESEMTIQPMVVALEDHGLTFAQLIEKHKQEHGDEGVTVYGIVGFNTRFKAAPAKPA